MMSGIIGAGERDRDWHFVLRCHYCWEDWDLELEFVSRLRSEFYRLALRFVAAVTGAVDTSILQYIDFDIEAAPPPGPYFRRKDLLLSSCQTQTLHRSQ
jgi:hypothetical protein